MSEGADLSPTLTSLQPQVTDLLCPHSSRAVTELALITLEGGGGGGGGGEGEKEGRGGQGRDKGSV